MSNNTPARTESCKLTSDHEIAALIDRGKVSLPFGRSHFDAPQKRQKRLLETVRAKVTNFAVCLAIRYGLVEQEKITGTSGAQRIAWCPD